MPTPPHPTPDDLHHQGRSLRALARSILGSTEGAEDVVQDAYAAALQRPAPSTTTPSNWLAGIVRNLARRHLRNRTRRRRHEHGAAVEHNPDPAPATDDIVADVQMHRDLADAVLTLADPYRTALVLRFWHDQPPRAIAARLGVPVATVKTHLQRGLAQLRHKLDARYGDRRTWLLALIPLAHPRELAAAAGAGTAATITTGLLLMNAKHTLVAVAAVACVSLLLWSPWSAADPTSAHPEPQPAVTPLTVDTSTDDPAPASTPDTPDPTDATDDPAPARQDVASDKPTGTVTGRVIRPRANPADPGIPIPAATVKLINLVPWPNSPDLETTTDAEGRFHFDVSMAGGGKWVPYRFLLASAPGLATRDVYLDNDIQDSIADDRLDLGDVELVRGVPCTGRVVDQSGAPLRSPALLMLWDPSYRGSFVSMFYGRVLGHTDSTGRFNLRERITPAPGGVLMLAAFAEDGIGWVEIGAAPGEQHLAPLDIHLHPAGTVTARILDPDGQPIQGATVSAVAHFHPIGIAPMWQLRSVRNSLPRIPEIQRLFQRVTGPDGTVTFPDLPLRTGQAVKDANRQQRGDRHFILSAAAKGFITDEISARPKPNDPTDASHREPEAEVVTLTLQRKHEVTITGFVRLPDGTPIAGLEVRGNGTQISSTSDAQGAYSLPPHTHGAMAYLIIDDPDYPRLFSTVEIPADTDTVTHDITVHPRAPVHGRVVDENGDPVAGARILLGIENGTHYRTDPEATGPDGRFAFPDAIATHDDLWITPPEPTAAWIRPQNQKVTNRADEVIVLRRITAELVPFQLAIVDGVTGTPLSPSDADIRLLPDPALPPDFQHIRPELSQGQVRVPELRPGNYQVIVSTAAGHRGRAIVRVGPDGTAPASLQLWEPVTIRCTLDTSGLAPTPENQADLANNPRMLAILDVQGEESFAIGPDGEPERLTPNTLMFRLGSSDTGRLTRVSPKTPLTIRLQGTPFVAETTFVAAPGTETQVTLELSRPGKLSFQLPAAWPQGKLEIAVASAATGPGHATATEAWHPLFRPHSRPEDPTKPLVYKRPAGPTKWRVRLWPDDGQPALERSGTTEVQAGQTTAVPLDG